MNKRYIGYFIAGLAVGYGAGYTICWWRRPIPQLVADDGKPMTQAPAKALLATGEAVQKLKPALIPLSKGNIPSPLDLYNIIKTAKG